MRKLFRAEFLSVYWDFQQNKNYILHVVIFDVRLLAFHSASDGINTQRTRYVPSEDSASPCAA